MLLDESVIGKLNWYPVYSVKEAISKTVTWYKEYFTNNDQVEKLTQNQISEYVEQAKTMNLRWTTNV